MRSGVGKQKKWQALEYQKYLFSISAWCIDWEMALAITMRMASSHLKVIRQNCIFFFLCRLHLGTALWENACLIGCVSRPQAPGALCSCICVCAQSTRQTTTTSIRNFSFFLPFFVAVLPFPSVISLPTNWIVIRLGIVLLSGANSSSSTRVPLTATVICIATQKGTQRTKQPTGLPHSFLLLPLTLWLKSCLNDD